MTTFSPKNWIQPLIASRKGLMDMAPVVPPSKAEAEGGCGVVGFACSVPVSGRNIFAPSLQMHNRGNGKGGGIAVAGLEPADVGVDAQTLRETYCLQIALLDPRARNAVEQEAIFPFYRVLHASRLEPQTDYRDMGLDVKPPDVIRYFVRAQPDALDRFVQRWDLGRVPARWIEDEYVYRNSFELNTRFYAALGEKRAFVLSHARNLMILKIVGYAEQVVQYYGLEKLRARVWIAHQRYPTKGRVWHPGGAHPFIGMNEALVHNGDFANYFSLCAYLRQHNMVPLFLTDTEVSVLLFDLLTRIYRYPLEYVIEALAPTTERDFTLLPSAKQSVYRAIQAVHMHGSPDGPWFFIIVRSDADREQFQLLGITDTSMLRPQVFALQHGDVSLGVIASEKQAIDAVLDSLHREDGRFRKVADRYWNARGGSHTDGGAFAFTVARTGSDWQVVCTDKFGRTVEPPLGQWRLESARPPLRSSRGAPTTWIAIRDALRKNREEEAFRRAVDWVAQEGQAGLRGLIKQVVAIGRTACTRAGGESRSPEKALALLTRLNDRRYPCGGLRRRLVLEHVRNGIEELLDSVPLITARGVSPWRRMDWNTRKALRGPKPSETTLVVDAYAFPPEGEDCEARWTVQAYRRGWHHVVIYRLHGQRFTGCGLGPDSDGVRLDVYGSSGDYLGSGLDGMELYVHDNAQDQVGQILKRGRLVIYGDVGQAFLYGAKGGEVYVMGNAAGRPLINAAGRPRVVINGTCLDYLAESFMAGDPHDGGGFVVLNGLRVDDDGRVFPLETPYPGGNLFSLASGGAIFVRDPHRLLEDEQLNGGRFDTFTEDDWELIRPYLETNERLFGISIERDLLTVEGTRREPAEVYRSVRAVTLSLLSREEIPE